MEQVSFDPLFPAAVGLLPLLNTHQLVSFPGNQRLTSAHKQRVFNKPFLSAGTQANPLFTYHDLSIVQGLGVLLKFFPNGEVDLVVSERAQGLRLEPVSVLDDHLRLVQVGCNLSGGEVDVCTHICARRQAGESFSRMSSSSNTEPHENHTFLQLDIQVLFAFKWGFIFSPSRLKISVFYPVNNSF